MTPENALIKPSSTQMSLPDFISLAGDRLGVPKSLRESIFNIESGFEHYGSGGQVKRSPKGALGVGQLMPDTAKRLGVDPNDPIDNAYGALKEQKRLYDKYLAATGDERKATLLAAAGYNAGEGAVDKYGGIPPYKETQDYVQNVATRLKQEPAPTTQPITRQPSLRGDPGRGRITAPITGYGSPFAGATVSASSDTADRNRIRQQILSEQEPLTEAGLPTTLNPITAIRRLISPTTNAQEVESQVSERFQAQQAQQAESQRLQSQFTDEDRQQIKDIADQLRRHGPGVKRGIDVATQQTTSGVLYKLAGLLGPGANPAGDWLRRKALAGELAVSDIADLPKPTREKVAEFLTNVGEGLVELAATPGGPVAKFAGLAGTAAVGRNRPLPEVVKETAKGAATGAAFDVPAMGTGPITRALSRGATVGGLTTGVESITGTPMPEALRAGVQNAVFAGVPELITRQPAAARVPQSTVSEELQNRMKIGEIQEQGGTVLNPEEVALGGKPKIRLPTQAAEGTVEQPHYSNFQPRRVRGNGKGQFKKGKPDVSTVERGVRPVPSTPEGHTRYYRADHVGAEGPLGSGWANDPEYVSKKYGAGEMGGTESIWYVDVPTKALDAEYGDARSASVIDSNALKAMGATEPKLYRRIGEAVPARAEAAVREPIERAALQVRPPVVTPPSLITTGSSATPKIPNVGDTIEYKEGFPNPRTITAKVVRLQTDPVTGDQVPIVLRGGNEWPAAEWYDTGRVVNTAPKSATPLPATPITRERSFPKGAEAQGLPTGTDLRYDVITDQAAVNRATQEIQQNGLDRSISDVMTSKEVGKPEITKGILLMQQLQGSGDVTKAVDVASELARRLTRAGQEVQAASIIARLSPEGVLIAGQRALPEGQKLTTEQSQGLVNGAAKLKEAEAKVAQLQQQIEQMKVPATPITRQSRTQTKIGTLEDRLRATEDAARARIDETKAKIASGELKFLNTGPVPGHISTHWADYATIGAAKLARKGMSTAKWTAEMLSDFGEEIRPFLQKLYRDSYKLYDNQRKTFAQERQVRGARKTIEGPLRQEDIQSIIKQRTEAQKEAMAARRGLARTFQDLSATRAEKVYQGITGLRRANLLTALKTHLRNLSGNTAFQMSEEVARPLSVLGDLLASRRTGQRTTTGLSIPATLKATYAAAIKEGPRRAADIMLGKEVLPLEGYKAAAESMGTKMQLGESNTGIKPLDVYINTVFRSLEAEDAIYKVYAFRRELADIAKARAINEKAPNVAARAKELQANPTDGMVQEAASYADYATFQNPNVVSKAISSGKRVIGPHGQFLVEAIAPFDRTPTNIIARAIENSPLGFVSAARKFTKTGSKAKAEELAGRIADQAFTAAEQKDFARTFGRASTGTILSALATVLAAKGLLSGASDYDTDQKDYMAKRREFGGGGMLRIPGTNQRISIIDNPVGKGMATAAGIYEQMSDKKKTWDQKATGSARLAASVLLLDQPLIKGIHDLASSKSVGEGAGNYAASYVPGEAMLRSAAEVADPNARIYRGQGASAPLRMLLPPQIPGGRGTLPVDTGIIRRERGGVARRIVRALDPFNTTTEGQGPIKRKK